MIGARPGGSGAAFVREPLVAFLPHGAGPAGGAPRSEWGATPAAGLVQLSVDR